MISVPSVIGNALANATGIETFDLPLDNERVFLALKKHNLATLHVPEGFDTAAEPSTGGNATPICLRRVE